MRIIEAVPNFSEGRDKKIIDQIAYSIQSVKGVQLLHVDVGESANRTVMTFAGEPDKVAEAAFRSVKKASELIDMNKHKGTHPRIGAVDVLPFVPISDVTIDECVALSERVGKRIGDELSLPVYCYEYSAKHEWRKRLEQIRRGEYEGLATKILLPEWKPDYGPVTFNPHFGTVIIGARQFLLAYNINLKTENVAIARHIAARIRESGSFVHGVRQAGILEYVKAIGWYMSEYQCVQVSTNLVNLQQTPVHKVYETVKKLARECSVEVTGSEIIGLTPLFVLTEAGSFYMKNDKYSENELIESAISNLGLNDYRKFIPDAHIIEHVINL
jgi:glutamate formiminotransferase / formiminotetrahydrofolate cyclodeaminase